MLELGPIGELAGKLLFAAASGGWGAFAALVSLLMTVAVVYLKLSKLHKKAINADNLARQRDALAKNPADNAADSEAHLKAEDEVEALLKGDS